MQDHVTYRLYIQYRTIADIYKSGRIAVNAIKLAKTGTSPSTHFVPDPSRVENKRARRRMKNTLNQMLVKCRFVSLNGRTVMKRMANKVSSITTAGMIIKFSRKAEA
jgi:hypothetical protein